MFINLLEMEYCPSSQSVETILQYPEELDQKNFTNEAHLNDFVSNVKKFAFPYIKTVSAAAAATKSSSSSLSSSQSSSLVQFYTFAFTDTNRIRQYGFCRSSQQGRHVLCLVSFLPWCNVFNPLLNRIATIINEKEVGCVRL
jgi:hypothetical protein